MLTILISSSSEKLGTIVYLIIVFLALIIFLPIELHKSKVKNEQDKAKEFIYTGDHAIKITSSQELPDEDRAKIYNSFERDAFFIYCLFLIIDSFYDTILDQKNKKKMISKVINDAYITVKEQKLTISNFYSFLPNYNLEKCKLAQSEYYNNVPPYYRDESLKISELTGKAKRTLMKMNSCIKHYQECTSWNSLDQSLLYGFTADIDLFFPKDFKSIFLGRFTEDSSSVFLIRPVLTLSNAIIQKTFMKYFVVTNGFYSLDTQTQKLIEKVMAKYREDDFAEMITMLDRVMDYTKYNRSMIVSIVALKRLQLEMNTGISIDVNKEDDFEESALLVQQKMLEKKYFNVEIYNAILIKLLFGCHDLDYIIENIRKIKENLASFNKQVDVQKILSYDESKEERITMAEIDAMGGFEFENFVADMFTQFGYKTYVTKASGDQGVDVIAEKEDVKLAIQAKCYHGVVGNKAIQECVAGTKYYKAKNGVVVTNSHFTNSAKELAKANGIILWDRDVLKQKLDEVDL